MNVLSIHSHVSAGHVGNSAAVYALQCLGCNVWPVHTVLLSHHPGHGRLRGHAVAAADTAEILAGLADHGVFPRLDAVLTGYLGGVETGAQVLDAWDRVRAARPDSLICCDPIMGDGQEGLYVSADLVGFYRDRAVPRADVIFPNAFELGVLAEAPVEDVAAVLAAARSLLARGPRVVVVTSVPADGIGTMVVSAAGAWLITTPRLPLRAKGTGDLLAALWLGRYLDTDDAVGAAERAVASVFTVGRAAAEADQDELPLVAERPGWMDPQTVFSAEKMS